MRQEIRRPGFRSDRGLIEIARDRKEALRAEKPAVRDLREPGCPQCLRQRPARHFDRAGVVDRHVALAAARLVVTGKHGNPLEQRGFAGAVLADDDRNRPFEGELEAITQERQAERIGLAVRNALEVEPDALEIRRWQAGPSALARHSAASLTAAFLTALAPHRPFVSSISANSQSRNARTIGRVSNPLGQTK